MKLLLGFIAIALWAHLLSEWLNPTITRAAIMTEITRDSHVHWSTELTKDDHAGQDFHDIANALVEIANGTCRNDKICR
jgi:hypothetical protein